MPFRTAFPYFERFVPYVIVKNKKYKNALLLAPEYSNNSAAERLSSEKKYYKEVSNMLKDLNINLVGIKTRHAEDYFNT